MDRKGRPKKLMGKIFTLYCHTDEIACDSGLKLHPEGIALIWNSRDQLGEFLNEHELCHIELVHEWNGPNREWAEGYMPPTFSDEILRISEQLVEAEKSNRTLARKAEALDMFLSDLDKSPPGSSLRDSVEEIAQKIREAITDE